MSWNRRYAVVSYLRQSLWIAPILAIIVSQVVIRLSVALGPSGTGFIPGFTFSDAARQTVADIGITLNLSFIVFTFGSLLVAVQVASGQLTPRIIATMLLKNNVIRWAVGLFTFGLLISVSARSRLDEVPNLIISLTAVMSMVSGLVFFYLIDYAARMLRPVTIVWLVGEAGLRVIREVFPDPVAAGEEKPTAKDDLGPPARTIHHEGTSAIVIAVNIDALTRAAVKANGVIELAPQVGDFVGVGEPLIQLRGGAVDLDDEFLRAQVAFGRERTIEQDATFALRVIVDIASKALSPAINDPTTAVLALDQLHRMLRVVGLRHLRHDAIRDKKGHVRLILRTPDWEDFVELACCEIRQYGDSSMQVVRRMRAMLENLLQTLPELRYPALQRELSVLDRTIEQSYAFPEELELARTPDTQGLGGTRRV
jgi:uncharacterized membrane protein